MGRTSQKQETPKKTQISGKERLNRKVDRVKKKKISLSAKQKAVVIEK